MDVKSTRELRRGFFGAHSAVQNTSSEPRLVIFSNFRRRDSPLLRLNPMPGPSPEVLARHSPEIQAILEV